MWLQTLQVAYLSLTWLFRLMTFKKFLKVQEKTEPNRPELDSFADSLDWN